jgi:hypothetical protein
MPQSSVPNLNRRSGRPFRVCGSNGAHTLWGGLGLAKEPRDSTRPFMNRDCLLSTGFVSKHKKILLDAVALYQTTIEGKWSQVILENPYLSILPDLKRQIESFHEIEGEALRLLQTAVAEYRKHLESLNKDSVPWVKMDNVKAQLQELDEQDFKEDLCERSHEASEHVT